MTVPAAPALWLDWCAVTGTDPASRDTEVQSRFARRVSAPRRVLNLLRARHEPVMAPAWPDALDGPEALQRVLDRGGALAGRRDTGCIERLRLRRLLFAAVLLAPPVQGGLGLTRQTALDLTPAGLHARPVSPRDHCRGHVLPTAALSGCGCTSSAPMPAGHIVRSGCCSTNPAR